jgi:hypothetical protein
MGIEAAVATAIIGSAVISTGAPLIAEALGPDDNSDEEARKTALQEQRARQSSYQQFLARQRSLGVSQLRTPGLKI